MLFRKNLYASLLLLLFTTPLLAQTVDFDRVIIPDDYKAKTFEEYLVQLAWRNSPEKKVLQYEVAIAKEEEEIQRWDWTKDLTAQFNYNEAHMVADLRLGDSENTDPLVQSLIFPRFNLAARISLGTILNYKNEKQITKLKTKIAEANIDTEKLTLRAKVLEQYEAYQTAGETRKLRIQAEEDSKQNYNLATNLFKAGEAKLDEFTSAATSYFNAKEASLDSRSEMQLARIKLEELIGVSLEEARRFGPKDEDDDKKKKKKGSRG